MDRRGSLERRSEPFSPPMIVNAILLVAVLSIRRLREVPYLPAIIFGLFKGAIYYVYTRRILPSAIASCLFAAVVALLLFFLLRLEKRRRAERAEVPSYEVMGIKKAKFQWEYVPLATLAVVIIAGEWLISAFLIVS